jgi:hypothetical protein
MKKVLVFSIFLLTFSGSLFAQNANIAQRIVGTWVDHEGTTWIFNANGNVSVGGENCKYGVTDTMLTTLESDGTLAIFNISISSDGRTLILVRTVDRNSMFSSGYWLTKR